MLSDRYARFRRAMNTARKHLTVLLALGAISLSAAARAAPEGNTQELSEEKARQILPRADLSGLTGAQRAQFAFDQRA